MRLDVALLIGAGFSVPAGISTMKGLAEDFAEGLVDDERAIYSKLLALVPEIREDFESLMECCRDFKNMSVGLFKRFLEERVWADSNILNANQSFNLGLVKELEEIVKGAGLLEERVKEYLREKCMICKDSIGYLYPLMGWLKKSGWGLDVFSLNYDLLIETLAEEFFIPYTDGFLVKWDSALFDDERYQIRLFKLHGSFIWYQSELGERIKIPIFYHKNEVKYLAQDKVVSMMVYPWREKREPFEELLWRFRERLLTLEKLVVIGYSFRDAEMKDIVEEGLRKNDKLHLVLVSPGAHELAKNFAWGNRIECFEGGVEDWVVSRNYVTCFDKV